MASKFRGGSDDWLDDQNSSRKRKSTVTKAKKAVQAGSEALPPEEANATVAEVFPKQCRVRRDDGMRLLCSYRWAGVVAGRGTGDDTRERSPVAVGDRVLIVASDSQSGVVERVCERRNALFRPAPGREGRKIHHIVAANVDILVIVASVAEPQFSPGLVDRYLVAAAAAGIEPLLILNKADLAHSETPWRPYADLGYEVFEVSTKKKMGIAELKSRLQEKTVVFSGQSGVGKTSLLNSLLGSTDLRVGAMSESTLKGKHTTSSAVLLEAGGATRWIDTPGVREFGLAEIEPEDLRLYFPEFKQLKCAEEDCDHDGQAGCEATDLPRYESYVRMFRSLKAGEH